MHICPWIGILKRTTFIRRYSQKYIFKFYNYTSNATFFFEAEKMDINVNLVKYSSKNT